MSIYDIRPLFERQNMIFSLSQNRILNQNTRFGLSLNVKKGFECQNAIVLTNSIVRIGFSMSKYDIQPQFQCQITIFGLSLNV